MKYVDQIRYYGDTQRSRNSSPNVNQMTLSSGSIFHGKGRIIQIGVQTLPGMEIYINKNPNPVIVGQTGIYELNLEGISSIYELKFGITQLRTINNPTNNAYLIVDYIYEQGD